MEDKTDAELVALASTGDTDAFGLLTRRYLPVAGRFAFRLVGREDLAEELAQEAVLQAYRSINRLRDPARFKAWLCGIVLNLSRAHLRDRRDVCVSLDVVMEGLHPSSVISAATPERLAEQKEENGIVLDAVMSLSPGDRDVLLLFYWVGLSVSEIAAAKSLAPGAVRVRLHRARHRFGECIRNNHPELIPVKRKKAKMIKVTIADIVRQDVSATAGQQKPMYVMILLDQDGKRFLPIWIDERQAAVIASGLRDFSFPRPMTHDFLLDLLGTVKAEVEEVRVQSLKGDTFYGVVKLRDGKRELEMDARPSDAIALAVRAGKPIFVAAEVMENVGGAVPAGGKPNGHGLDAILEELRQEVAEYRQRPVFSEAEIQKKNEELLKTLFG